MSFLGTSNPFGEAYERPDSPSDKHNPFIDDLRAAAAASAVAMGDKNPFEIPSPVEQSKLCVVEVSDYLTVFGCMFLVFLIMGFDSLTVELQQMVKRIESIQYMCK